MENTLYKKNLQAIKEYDKTLYDSYLEYKKNSNDKIENNHEIEIENYEALNGSNYWTVKTKERTIRMNSLCNPEEEAKIWAEQFKIVNLEMVVLLFGLGDGKFYHELKKKGKDDTKLVIFEPSVEMFEYQMTNINMDEIINEKNTVLIINQLNDKAFYDVLATLLTIYNYEYCLEISIPEYNHIFENYYKEYKKIIDNMKNALDSEYYTCVTLADLWTNTSLFNLRYIKESQMVSQYKDKFPKEIPVIIVSAGPSLDYNVDKLKLAKGKAVIIATDTAMPQLVRHEIEPDFIATIDAKKSPAHLEDEMCQHIPYICTDMARIEIMEHHKDQKIFYEVSPYLEQIFNEIGKDIMFLGSGTSVATVTFSACVTMGFKTIIFVGQDLAYRNGMSHAGNNLRREEGNYHIEIEDIYGNMVESREEWYRFLLWFENAIKELSEKTDVIDATEGGAKIHGTTIMTLEEAINKYCTHEIDCKRLVKSIPPAMDKEDWEKFKGKIQHLFIEIEEIDNLTKQGERVIKELMECLRKKKFGSSYEKKIRKINQINEKVSNKAVYELLDTYMYSAEEDELDSRKGVNEMNDDLDEDEMKTYKIANEFYVSLGNACKAFKPKLQEYYNAMLEADK